MENSKRNTRRNNFAAYLLYSEYSQTNFTDDAAIDEITADYASKLVNDVETFRELVRADKTVAERFIESVKEFIAKVKTTFSKDKTKADTASLEKYGATVSEFEAAVKTYENMIKTTQTAVILNGKTTLT